MDFSPIIMAKTAVESFTGLSKDALHIHVGLLLLLTVAATLRRSLASPLPWLVVLVVAVLGEAVDIGNSLQRSRTWLLAPALHDLFNTLAWPTLLLILARLGWLPRAGFGR